MAVLVEQWLPPMVAEGNLGDDDLMHRLRSMSIEAGIEGYERQIEALLHRPEVQSLLPGIACPTLVVVGSEDRWSPIAQHAAIAAAISAAELRIVQGAGHMMPAETPGALNAILADWLNL